jgi:ribosomal protein S12 methylthiotransferase
MSQIHFISLGCPKNLVDAEVMLGLLTQQGHTFTTDPASADIIIVNTCAFIEDAKKEAIGTILEMAEHKRAGRCSMLVVAGCLPQRYRDEAEKLFPEVDAFVGAGEFHRIADVVDANAAGARVHVGRPTYLYDHTTPRVQATPPHRAYIKIAEGCFHPCSFCIIPKIRGGFRSRQLTSIVEEACGMLARGVREINLVGQDTTAYGRDVGSDLASLLAHLAELDGEKWIRFLYAYPHDFPERVIDVMRDRADVCKYLDIPIQHISERVLAAMRRKGEGAEIRRLLDRLRERVPGIALRTSVIVGFPGETEAEFRELLAFVREARFDHLGVFTYSPEEGTAAFKLPKRVPAKIAEERRCLIMEAQQGIAAAKNAANVGRRIRVLVEGPSEESELLIAARHEGQAPDIDGVVYINDGDPPVGDFCTVEITEAHDYDLVGRVVTGD